MIKLQISIVVLAMAAGSVAQDFSPAFAQAAAKPSFEVASVKPNKSGEAGMSIGTQPGGRYVATNTPLRMLILNAFALQGQQLVGLPNWASSERFDILAIAGKDIPQTKEGATAIQLMLQSLLQDRFALRAHFETQELPAYALVLARADGTLGPQLKASPVDCEALAAARRAGGPPDRGVGAVGTVAPAAGERRPCSMRMGRGTITAGTMTMANLAGSLSSAVQRTVIDRTGLTGGFDLDLTYSLDQTADATSPSLFTALQEQLGLKLESVRVPTQVVVIDSIERPTPD
jgi:uncharacterized protein (TIGR03435 family)